MVSIPWHRRGPVVVENVLSDELCDELLRHFKSNEERPRSYQGIVDESQRKCSFVDVSDTLADLVTEAVNPHVYGFFGVESRPMPGQSQLIYRYGQGIGFVTHHDEVTDIERRRAKDNGQPVIGGDLTTVLFLNHPDEYGGGSLYFESPAVELRPQRGALVAFPATRDFMHGVRKIERGERYTLLARRAVLE